jgi:nuclear transport factor 2 (NTF2) superfamily protein
MMSSPPLPPFTAESAAQKARAAEAAWNTRGPARVALAYTIDSVWRNRSEFFQGRAAIEAFLARKWNRELDYRLIKEVWTFARTASQYGSLTNGTTTAAIGSVAVATRTGNSTSMA